MLKNKKSDIWMINDFKKVWVCEKIIDKDFFWFYLIWIVYNIWLSELLNDK